MEQQPASSIQSQLGSLPDLGRGHEHLCTCSECNPDIDCAGISRTVKNSAEYVKAVVEQRLGTRKGMKTPSEAKSNFDNGFIGVAHGLSNK